MDYRNFRDISHTLLTKQNLLTIPNGLSLFRLILCPFIITTYIDGHIYQSVTLIVLSALTDIIDGYLARRFNWISEIGKMLDPLADKLTQLAMFICLINRHPWVTWLIVLFLIKEIMQGLCGYFVLKKTGFVNTAKWYGKASTATLYTVMIIIFLFPALPERWVGFLVGAAVSMLILALVLYMRFYIELLIKSNQKDR